MKQEVAPPLAQKAEQNQGLGRNTGPWAFAIAPMMDWNQGLAGS
jgi:hypothetical protein